MERLISRDWGKPTRTLNPWPVQSMVTMRRSSWSTMVTADAPKTVVLHDKAFDWGSKGAVLGCYELAINILAIYTSRADALELHQKFSEEFIESMPWSGGVIEADQVIRWLREQWRAANAADLERIAEEGAAIERAINEARPGAPANISPLACVHPRAALEISRDANAGTGEVRELHTCSACKRVLNVITTAVPLSVREKVVERVVERTVDRPIIRNVTVYNCARCQSPLEEGEEFRLCGRCRATASERELARLPAISTGDRVFRLEDE